MHAIDDLIADPSALSDFGQSLDTLHPGSIRCAKIKITSRCNLRCAMCHYSDS